MGSDTMTASAPEEGRKCWLKVTFEGKARLVEWNTAWSSFKDMDTKVRKMFSLHDKVRVIYSYVAPIAGSASEILMSSDEELSTAMRRMHDDVLLVDVKIERKRKKGPLCRVYRAAKAQQPRVSQFVASVPATVTAGVRAVPALVQRFMAASCPARARARSADADADAGNANSNVNPNANVNPANVRACRRSCKLFVSLFVLIMALMVARCCVKQYHQGDGYIHLHTRMHNFPNYFSNFEHHVWGKHHGQHHGQQHGQHHTQDHVTILAAAYGGRDVTRLAQDFYNRYRFLQASNNVYGDPMVGEGKYLHVVFQRIGHNGVPEVFSQSIMESDATVALTPNKDTCDYPDQVIVNGYSVKVLGVLFDGKDTTCAARRLFTHGYFPNVVNSRNFGVKHVAGRGAFTMVYMKNNVVQMVTARDGQSLVL